MEDERERVDRSRLFSASNQNVFERSSAQLLRHGLFSSTSRDSSFQAAFDCFRVTYLRSRLLRGACVLMQATCV